MTDMTFETALVARTNEMLDACTRCGKCVEVCPVTGPASVGGAAPEGVISGVIDLLRGGEGTAAAQAWAKGCVGSGDCIEACPESIIPRFLLAMTRIALNRKSAELRDVRRKGIANFRLVADGVRVLSQIQLSDKELARLGQAATARLEAGSTVKEGERPDFVFYTGCNVLKTPHIALLALDIMDALGISYKVMGGPNNCCGVVQLRAGDPEVSGRQATSTLDRLSQAKSGVISWCPSCRPVHRDDAADGREDARRAAVRDDAVHAVPQAAP